MSEIPTVTIDGKEYILDQLSEQHRTLINHIQIADQLIAQYQTQIAILTTGRQAYINELGEELGKDDPEFTPEVVQ